MGVVRRKECQHGNLKYQWEEEGDKYSNKGDSMLARIQTSSLHRRADTQTHTNTSTLNQIYDGVLL